MSSDSAGNDPRTIWKNQPTEPSALTLDNIRKKTRELHAKTRRDLIKSVAGPLAVIVICVFGLQFPHPALRAALAFSLSWSLAGQYFLNRGMWSATLPGDAGLQTGLDSYRREVERRRSLFGRVLLWQFGPVVLAIAILILVLLTLGIGDRGMLNEALVKGTLRKMTPFLVLTVLWMLGIFVVRMRQRRELQREIDELNEVERASQ
jgi:hypothetical protein